jgi:hypothetical protein
VTSGRRMSAAWAVAAWLAASQAWGRPLPLPAPDDRGEDSVTLTLPSGVAFVPERFGADSPQHATTTVSFEHARLRPGDALRISVRAEPRPRRRGPWPEVRFRARAARGGRGFDGALSDLDYTTVLEAAPDEASGSVSIEWTMPGLPPGSLAGTYRFFLLWKAEVVPGAGRPAATALEPAGPGSGPSDPAPIARVKPQERSRRDRKTERPDSP